MNKVLTLFLRALSIFAHAELEVSSVSTNGIRL